MIQSSQFSEHSTVTILPVTSTILSAPLLRVTVQPDAENGLQRLSQVMVDKALTLKRDKIGAVFGRISGDVLVEIDRCLAVFLGIVK